MKTLPQHSISPGLRLLIARRYIDSKFTLIIRLINQLIAEHFMQLRVLFCNYSSFNADKFLEQQETWLGDLAGSWKASPQ